MTNEIAESKVRLKNIIKKYKKQKSIDLTEKIITVNAKNENLWETVLLICFFIILPILCTIYFIFNEMYNIYIGIPALLMIPFWNLIKNIFTGEPELEINFKEKYLVVKNANLVLKKFNKTKKIKFNEVSTSELNVKSYDGEYTDSEWIELFITDKKGEKILLANFNNKLPESLIAKELNIIITLIKN